MTDFNAAPLRGKTTPASSGGSYRASEHSDPESTFDSDQVIIDQMRAEEETANNHGVVARLKHDEFGKLRIVQDEHDPETYTVQGADGNVTFRANANSTPDQLISEGLDFYIEDDLSERGQGLEDLDREDSLRFTHSYLQANLTYNFIGGEDELDEYDEGDDLSPEDFDDAAVAQATEDLDGFLRANYGLVQRAIDAGSSYSQVAHDFALTRNGHGTGFWDRGYGELGDDLTEASKTYGSVTAMRAADDKVQLM